MKKIIFWGSITITFITLLFLGYMFLKSEPKEEEIYNDIAVNDVLVEEVFKSIDSGSNYDFQSDVYKKGTFSNQYILGLSISRYFLDHSSEKEVSETNVDAYIKKIFGKVTYAHESGYFLNANLCKFTYDKITHSYKINTECNHVDTKNILKKRTKAYKTATVLYVEEKIIVTEEKNDGLHVYGDIYQNKELEKKEPIKIEDYLDEAETYLYKFEFDGESFVFKEIKKINS